jgi:hypothetical protein
LQLSATSIPPPVRALQTTATSKPAPLAGTADTRNRPAARPLGAGRLLLLNAQGQTVREQPLLNAEQQILTTQGLPAGVYTVLVQAGPQVLTRKLQVLP